MAALSAHVIFVAQIRLVDSKKITSDPQETVLLESRSLSNLLHSPVATLQVPAHWKMKVEYELVSNDEIFAQGIDGNLFKVSFENTAPKSYEREFVYCSPSFPNDALLELCKRGPQVIYSSKWQGEPNWNKTDKRWQQASKIFHDINRLFSKSNFSNNQFMNPKSPQFIVTQAEVKKVDGKSVIAISGFELDGKTRKLNQRIDVIYLPIPNGPGVACTYGVGVECPVGSNLAKNDTLLEKILDSTHWSI